MSKLTDSFKAARVFNSHNFYDAGRGSDRVYITYQRGSSGRWFEPQQYEVAIPGGQTDPDAHWRDYGCKTFALFGHKGTLKEKRDAALAEAQAWASEKYGITEWAKDPYGSWGDAEYVKARTADLTRQARELGTAA